jgi:hypothetical protein
MAQITLTDEEARTLLHTLQEDLSDLRMEIADTDRMEFRDQLKGTKALFESIIQKLQRSLQEEGQGQPTQTLT